MKYLLLIESFHNTAQYRSYREGINCELEIRRAHGVDDRAPIEDVEYQRTN